MLLPDGGRLTIHYPVRSSVASPGQPDKVETRVIGAEIDGHTVSDSIALGAAGTLLLEIPAADVRSDQLFAGHRGDGDGRFRGGGTVVAAVTAGAWPTRSPISPIGPRRWARASSAHWRRYGISELDRVSSALGDANAEIALRLERERETVGDVSHQLRSRLTAIQLRLDELTLHEDSAVVVRPRRVWSRSTDSPGSSTSSSPNRVRTPPRPSASTSVRPFRRWSVTSPGVRVAGRSLVARGGSGVRCGQYPAGPSARRSACSSTTRARTGGSVPYRHR